MIRLICLFYLILVLCSCNNPESAVTTEDEFALLDHITVQENEFDQRTFLDDLFELREQVLIPEYIGNIYQLQEGKQGMYINDTDAIYRYDSGGFETVFKPVKGEGPNEVSQVFRFDIHDDTKIAIAGYPGNRIMTHSMDVDSTSVIETMYRSNVLLDGENNIYGKVSGGSSSNFMFTKFNAAGDSLTSFGHLFDNQDKSLNMFDLYWDYNSKHNLIVVGFMYVGYYAVFNTDGSLRYITESTRHPGKYPVIVERHDTRFVDADGNTVLRYITSNNDEIHIFTANATNRDGESHGAVVDVIDIKDGSYQFSYVLDKPLHWPILLLEDGSIASVTQDYELMIWNRTRNIE